MLTKSVFRRIRSSLGRYLAILGIIALGVGFFSGLRVTAPSMLKTADEYVRELKLFDFRLVSTLGFTDEDVRAFSEAPGVEGAYGSFTADFLCRNESGSDVVFRAHSLLDGCNECDLTAGRMPERDDECLLDGKFYDESWIGQKLILSEDNGEDVRKRFAYAEYTVTGIIHSVYYINFERGGSELGSGSVSGYVYMPLGGFSNVSDETDETYYTELFIRLTESAEIYSDAYDALIDARRDPLSALLDERAEARYEKLIADAQAEIDDYQRQLDDARDEYETGLAEYESGLAEYEASREEMNEQLVEFTENRPYVPAAAAEAIERQLDDAFAALDEVKLELDDAKKELDDALPELEENQARLDDAKEKLTEIDRPNVYVLDRSGNVGYACLDNDTSIVTGVSKVFPLFFFIVAALVCTTTMTRMVDELRTENGVLKALGFGNAAIAGQFLFYSGSASLLGSIIGFLIGSKFLPMALWGVYHIMYSVSRSVCFVLDWKLFAWCTLLYMLCSLGATWLVCRRMLREQAAELIRPKAPSAGKRIFLERMPFLWKRMKFLHKVSARNILRYKKRMIMMIIGIGGCTALLITGFGIRDTIKPILDHQYSEIETYDESVTFIDCPDESERANFLEQVGEHCDGVTFLYTGSIDVTGDKTETVNFMVFTEAPERCFNLHAGSEPVAWPGEGECVVDFRLARSQGLSVGDEITLLDGDLNTLRFTVSGIYDNYIYDFLFVSASSVAAQLGEAPEAQTAFLRLNGDTDAHELSAGILGMENVASVSINADMRARIGSMFKSLDYIVLIVLVCAGALAFIVLFNLSNISITERTREIATLKVLGFYKKETAAYVFRENLVLTAVSAVCGIPMGLWLLRYVMDQIRIKSMYFGWRLSPGSLAASIVLTFVFAVVSELFLTKKLENVNMAESLKAIE